MEVGGAGNLGGEGTSLVAKNLIGRARVLVWARVTVFTGGF